MSKRILAAVLVVTALPIGGDAVARDLKATEIAGRWSGASYSSVRSGEITFDIVACGDGWCGVRVEGGDKCGATGLKLNAGVVEENNAQFQGTLSLAPGRSPTRSTRPSSRPRTASPWRCN